MPNSNINNNGGGGVVVDSVLPVLTSRFLLALPRRQDDDDIDDEKKKQQQDEILQLVTKMTAAAAHQTQNRYQTEQQEDEADCFANLPTNLFAEEEAQASPLLLPVPVPVNQLMVVSPGNSRTSNYNNNNNNNKDIVLWASDSFNTTSNNNNIINIDPDRRLSCPLPSTSSMIAAAVAAAPPHPTTPRRSTGGGGGGGGSSLFASFSSSTPTSEMSPSLWQYGAGAAVGAASPRTTDAVAQMEAAAAADAEASAWMQQENCTAMIPLAPPFAGAAVAAINVNVNATTGLPPLPQLPPAIDGIPTMIRCYCDYMDDEVSLLADDPEDDDDNVLPNTTYDVLANTGIFAEEDDDE
jgi:hypothetical protein